MLGYHQRWTWCLAIGSSLLLEHGNVPTIDHPVWVFQSAAVCQRDVPSRLTTALGGCYGIKTVGEIEHGQRVTRCLRWIVAFERLAYRSLWIQRRYPHARIIMIIFITYSLHIRSKRGDLWAWPTISSRSIVWLARAAVSSNFGQNARFRLGAFEPLYLRWEGATCQKSPRPVK